MHRENFSINDINMYVCGPTVYDSSHLGHARTYITVDLIVRTMNLINNTPCHLVMNITDIDDKIIKKANAEGVDWIQIAKTYEKSFFNSMSKLNVKLPDVVVRVSDVMPQIILYIQKIVDNGFGYVTSDGSVYFDSEAYVSHGYSFGDLVDEDETQYQSELSPLVILQKKNKKDFALWKGRTKSEVGFEAQFIYKGKSIPSWGRPGWHIECSTMIHETIGSELDIHLGGIDLKFPHHHNERLQAHAYYHPKFKPNTFNPELNKQWSTNFYHIGHLCVVVENDKKEMVQQKMSKSLKNFTTIDEALKEITANQLRWMFVMHKWTDTMDFSEQTINHAKSYDTMITNFFNRVANYPFNRQDVVYNKKEYEMLESYKLIKTKIQEALASYKFDVTTTHIQELINKTNSYISIDRPNESLVRKIYFWIINLTNNLGFVYEKATIDSTADVMNVLINTRSAIRTLTRDKNISKETKQKLFEILDNERNVRLPEIGITLLDTKESSSWFKK
ncbi:cysteinyl-tRNA synthetase [Tupanvirus deep ocean]|uniref:Cysteinyl-tRNA synthetase n=2 Tax=Tupanvirus TaxID=2094720 RepID=A0AC62AA17_9VIRU|nr:cysteinyl-tRNA synthetase [Tupanvirus deep ocean]QKU34564.1 cysteinyl-tRNA synthetase [Tupanvirus deep ocean]